VQYILSPRLHGKYQKADNKQKWFSHAGTNMFATSSWFSVL